MKKGGSALERALKQYRAQLDAREHMAFIKIVDTYTDSYHRLSGQLALVNQKIEEAVANGQTVSRAWIYQQERFIELQAQIGRELDQAQKVVGPLIETEAGAAIDLAQQHAQGLVKTSLGNPGRAGGKAPVLFNSWAKLNPGAVSTLLGFVHGEGSPLGQLLASLAPSGKREIGNALADGLARGLGPRETGRLLSGLMGGQTARALTIARTETMRAYREATRASYQANKHLVLKWEWVSALDRRTCAACWAMHGQVFKTESKLDGHPSCRCVMVPITPSWQELGDKYGFDATGLPETTPKITTGEELFAQLDEATQKAILGPAKHKLLQEGSITLRDVVQRPLSQKWGTMRREATVTEALKNAAKRGTPKPPPKPRPAPKIEKPIATVTSDFGKPVRGFDAIDRALARDDGHGSHVLFDGGDIEDLDVRVTRINWKGQNGVEARFKLTQEQLSKLRAAKEAAPAAEYREVGEVTLDKLKVGDEYIYKGGAGAKRSTVTAHLGDRIQWRDVDGRTGSTLFSQGVKVTKLEKLPPPKPTRAAKVEWQREPLKVPKKQQLEDGRYAVNLDDPAYAGRGNDRLLVLKREWGEVRVMRAPDSRAFDGTVQVWVKDGFDKAAAWRDAMEQLGVRTLTHPTPADVRAYIEARVMHTLDPQGKSTLAAIERRFGFSIDEVKLEPGPGGRPEPVLPAKAAQAIVRETGAEVFTHSVSFADADSLMALLTNPRNGLLSTTQRWAEGVGRAGMSSTSDVGTGGADYVFTRWTRRAYAPVRGTYIIFKGERLMRRLDWFAYGSDSYGSTRPERFNHRGNLAALKGNNDRGITGGAEAMFKHAISLDDVDKIIVNGHVRSELLAKLRARGITRIGGRKIEEVIQGG